MNDNYKLLTPVQLQLAFLSSAVKNIKYIEGLNPFLIDINGERAFIYIKNLSPAQLTNNNHDVWRIQLPVRDEFESIKNSSALFVLLGYDSTNEVYTTWNPYWCKQRLNVGKSVSMYSRLSLQQRVSKKGEIEQLDLNNDGNVICIPRNRISEYLVNIKEYYPQETVFIAKGSIIQKRQNKQNVAEEIYELFKDEIDDADGFFQFLINDGVSKKSSRDYCRHISNLIKSGFIDRYKEIFLKRNSLSEYADAIYELLHIDEVAALDKQKHGYFRTSLRHYLDYLLSKSKCSSINEDTPQIVSEPNDPVYKRNEFGQLIALDNEIKKTLAKYVIDEDYPDYDEMINICSSYYPDFILDKMTYTDWIKLFENTNWKKSHTSPNRKTNKTSAKIRTKTIRVTRPDGSIIQHGFVADTYIEVIKESYPDLIMEMGLYHAGVNIVSREYDEKYKAYQKDIGEGYLVMVNSTTEAKYEDLCFINKELELGLKVELIDKDRINIETPKGEYTKSNGERYKIRVTFPNGRTIQYGKVLETLVEVVKYAGPQKVASLNINVCFENMVLRTPLEKYKIACKPVGDGWYVNTASDTTSKYKQICEISERLNLGLIVELV